MSISTSTAATSAELAGLAALEERLRDDFVTLGWPAKAWIPASTRKGLPVHDVLVIGAGQAGLALSMALQQVGIRPVLLDRSAPDFEGPWATTARMETLRSPKELTGPAMGVAALSFRAWFIAQFGLDGLAAVVQRFDPGDDRCGVHSLLGELADRGLLVIANLLYRKHGILCFCVYSCLQIAKL